MTGHTDLLVLGPLCSFQFGAALLFQCSPSADEQNYEERMSRISERSAVRLQRSAGVTERITDESGPRSTTKLFYSHCTVLRKRKLKRTKKKEQLTSDRSFGTRILYLKKASTAGGVVSND